MPELPEVETIRRQLAPRLEGRVLESVEIRDPRWTRPEPLALVQEGLTGRRVASLGRRGKYMDWVLDGDGHLLVHLRMTGTLLYDAAAEPLHTRVRFALDDGHTLLYVDPRRFGTGHLLEGGAARDAYLAARLGVEPLGPEFTGAVLRERARGRRIPVKSFLLDQRTVAGVGNIYADEALHRAGIHPLRPAGKLTTAQFARLRDAVVEALTAGLDAGGATIDDYRDVDGARGAFQDEFLVHLRAGRPCPACGTPVRKLVVGGRATYVCERCQPRPRLRRAPGKVRARPGVSP
jgi:formamidopyrimidine-DNA glycosylase